MIIFKKISQLKNHLQFLKNENKKTGFVPTMGALHQGHLSLIALSKKQNDITICSIFINPTQFNDGNDFKNYPVTIEKDIYLLETNHTDILFLPSVDEIYPNGTTDLSNYPLGSLETMLEGKFRPRHFQGVCQVVHRLLNIIEPNNLYLGQKDYQQCLIIKKLIQFIQIPVTLIISPTLREEDGLAMSSRNLRLQEQDRKKASAIYNALLYIKKNIAHKNIEQLEYDAVEQLQNAGFEKVDYVEIADAETLQPVKEWNKNKNAVVLAAAFLNKVRLIDNLLLQQ